MAYSIQTFIEDTHLVVYCKVEVRNKHNLYLILETTLN